MSKKILISAVIILALIVTLTACKGSKNDETTQNSTTTDKVVNSVVVTGEDGGTTNVEIYEDKDGEQYITNVNGEKVPLTTDANGYGDDVGYLITSTPSKDNTASTSTEIPDTSTTVAETVSGNHIIIGDENQTQQDVISYDQLKNPQNYT